MIALIAPIAGVVATTAVGVAITNAAQLVIPPAANALAGFGIKAGVAVVSFIAGSAISKVVVTNLNSVAETLNEIEEEPSLFQEDN